MTDRHPIWQLADAIQMDLRAATGKLVELRSQLSALELGTKTGTNCPRCGIELAGPKTLAEHTYTSHDGPLPDHWEAIETKSLEPADPTQEATE